VIEVTVDISELKGIHHPEEYIQNKLRKAGVPISGIFSLKAPHNGQLTKYKLTDKLYKFVWSN
jgi:hypothetical protein